MTRSGKELLYLKADRKEVSIMLALTCNGGVIRVFTNGNYNLDEKEERPNDLFFLNSEPPLPNPGDTVWVCDEGELVMSEAIFISKTPSLNEIYPFNAILKEAIARENYDSVGSYQHMRVNKPDDIVILNINGDVLALSASQEARIKEIASE